MTTREARNKLILELGEVTIGEAVTDHGYSSPIAITVAR